MLKTETNDFGAKAARYNPETGECVSPEVPGLRITATQLPLSLQREPFEYLCRHAFPAALPGGLLSALDGGGVPKAPDATETPAGGLGGPGTLLLSEAYAAVRRLAATPGALEYLQTVFSQNATVEITRKGKAPAPVALTAQVWDEFGTMPILLEFIAWAILFNFAEVINLLPEWSKEGPSIVAGAVEKATNKPAQ